VSKSATLPSGDFYLDATIIKALNAEEKALFDEKMENEAKMKDQGSGDMALSLMRSIVPVLTTFILLY